MSTVMKLCGVALLWAGLAALVYVPTAASGLTTTVVAGLGFLSFASGLMLFGDALKREIAAQLRRDRNGSHSEAILGGAS